MPPRPAGLALPEASGRLRQLAERQWIEEALAGSATISDAARVLGIDRKTLREKMTALGIEWASHGTRSGSDDS